MKDPCDDIRDWLYASLNGYLTYGGVAVPVYSFPPQATTPVTAPYVVIGEHSAEIETGAKDTYMWDVSTNIEVYSFFPYTKASYKQVNNISSQILQLLRQRNYGGYGREEGYVAMNNFNVIRVQVESFATERMIADNNIVVSKILSINTLVEEL